MIVTSFPMHSPEARVYHSVPQVLRRITALAVAMLCLCLFTLEVAAQTNWMDDTVPAGAWTGADGWRIDNLSGEVGSAHISL